MPEADRHLVNLSPFAALRMFEIVLYTLTRWEFSWRYGIRYPRYPRGAIAPCQWALIGPNDVDGLEIDYSHYTLTRCTPSTSTSCTTTRSYSSVSLITNKSKQSSLSQITMGQAEHSSFASRFAFRSLFTYFIHIWIVTSSLNMSSLRCRLAMLTSMTAQYWLYASVYLFSYPVSCLSYPFEDLFGHFLCAQHATCPGISVSLVTTNLPDNLCFCKT